MSDFTAVRVGQLPEEIWSGTDNLPHEVGTDLKRGTVADLATYIAGIIDASAGLAFNPLKISDGQTLPETTVNEWIIVGQGTYLQSGGFSNVVCTDDINIVISNGVSWSLGFGIAVDGVDTSQFVKLLGNQTIDGVKTFTDSPIVPTATLPTQAVNFGQLDAVAQNAIPYTGTEVGKPITGDLEFVGETYIVFKDGNNIYSRFGFDENGFSINEITDYGTGGLGKSGFRSTQDGLNIYSDNPSARGLTTDQNFSPNITDLDYTQKIYVDNAITEASSNAIPYTGTTQPITGYLEVSNGKGFIYQDAFNINRITIEDAGIFLYCYDIVNDTYSQMQINATQLLLLSTRSDFRGLSGDSDYSPNIQDLDYTQKIYVDNAISGAELLANKNQNNGYSGLDSGGKIPLANLPTTLLKYQGVWNANTNTPTLTSPDLTKVGNVYNVSVAGTRFGITWGLGDWLIYNASGIPEKSDNSDDVVSVNGQTGVVTLTKSDVGLSLVDNTSDLNKPVSTATQTALNLKANLANPTFTGSVVVPNAVNPNEAVNLSQLESENNVYQFHDFLTTLSNESFALVAQLSGTINANNANVTVNNQGVARITSSTTANSGFSIRGSGVTRILKGGEVTNFIFNPLTFVNTTFRDGIHDATTVTAPNNGVYFEYSGSGVLSFVTANNGTRTTTTVNTILINTWYKLRITVNANATSVVAELFNNVGTLITSITQTTNIPDNTRLLNRGCIVTNSGTTATNLIDVDFISTRHANLIR